MRELSTNQLGCVRGAAGASLGAAAAGAWTGFSIGKYIGSPATGAAVGGVIGAAAAGVARKDPWCLVPAVPAAVGGFMGGGPAGATAAAAGMCAAGTLFHDSVGLAGK